MTSAGENRCKKIATKCILEAVTTAHKYEHVWVATRRQTVQDEVPVRCEFIEAAFCV